VTWFTERDARRDRFRQYHPHRRALLIVGIAFALLLGAVAAPPVHTAGNLAGDRPPREEGRAAGVKRQPVLLARGLFPPLSSAEAWRRLPRARVGSGRPLPLWARSLAAALPQTTAAMLRLDYLHRVCNPLPPRLRAQLRWVAAHANHSPAGEAYAAADLRAAGVDEDGLRALAGDLSDFPDADRAALRFARQLTVAGDEVTDEEVARLLGFYGEKQVVAMVLLLAHAGFQDRLLLALDVPPDDGGALGPLEVQFAERPLGAVVARPLEAPPPAPAAAPAAAPPDPAWTGLDAPGLQQALEHQRARRSRIALPGDRPGQVHWGLVCRAYQPELAAAWSACMHAFAAEAEQDPVFEQSLFWVVTASLHCFY
jgi:alkylhydroperoxidase family enzyme